MKNILVPIGSSQGSHETLQYAVDFAAQFGSSVYAMEVFSASAKAGNLANISEAVERSSKQRLIEVIGKVNAGQVELKIATYKGDLVDGLKKIDEEFGIDLVIIAARCNDAKEELYLGNTTGSIIKQTNIPSLIVPRGASFSPFKNILTAFKSGTLKNESKLDPLKEVAAKFGSTVNLLQVITPELKEEELEINPSLRALGSNLVVTEHANTYLGVLEQFQSHHPDLLCVFRRKRGFFKALWEKNTIPKSEFSSRVPVLVLSVKTTELA